MSIPPRSATDAEFFREFTLRLCCSLDLDVALHRSIGLLMERLPVVEIWASVIDFDSWTLRPLAMANKAEGKAFGEDGPRTILPESARKALASIPLETVQRVDDSSADPLSRAVGRRYGAAAGALLNLRLSLDGHRVGGITLRSDSPGAFTTSHVALVEGLRAPFAVALSNFARHQEVKRLKELLAEDNRFLRKELLKQGGEDLVGIEGGLREVAAQLRRVGQTNSPVLLLGETGTGKEILANFIHRHSDRMEGPLIKVNCGAIPENLIDSELFGHEKGAFTGAMERKRGLFERADGGTLFLDEIGELPPLAQVRLLRALQERQIQRVGGQELVSIDVRIIAATHRDLPSMVGQGTFREDLWFRLGVFPVRIPPLRERKQDIPALVQHFLSRRCRELGFGGPPRLRKTDLRNLERYPWPGNVRELQNVVERALILGGGQTLEFEFLNKGASLSGMPGSSSSTLAESEAQCIRKALRSCKNRVEGPFGAALLLGIHPSTLRHRMRKLGIAFGRAELR